MGGMPTLPIFVVESLALASKDCFAGWRGLEAISILLVCFFYGHRQGYVGGSVQLTSLYLIVFDHI
jgi:hypothetical protein